MGEGGPQDDRQRGRTGREVKEGEREGRKREKKNKLYIGGKGKRKIKRRRERRKNDKIKGGRGERRIREGMKG